VVLVLPREIDPHESGTPGTITRTGATTIEEWFRKIQLGLTYSPISPSPGILGRLSVDSSGGSRKPAHEQSKSDETTRKTAAAHTVVALMQ
jgi:hypothetical protein